MLVALKWGAIVGVLLYAAGFVVNLVTNTLVASSGSTSVTEHPVLLLPICLGLFVLLFALSAAGFYTGRETGRAPLGALAGVVTFVVQYALGLVADLFTGVKPQIAGSQPGLSLGAQILAALVAPLLFLGLAASMGWLGGRPGAQQYARRMQAAQEAAQPVQAEPPA